MRRGSSRSVWASANGSGWHATIACSRATTCCTATSRRNCCRCAAIKASASSPTIRWPAASSAANIARSKNCRRARVHARQDRRTVPRTLLASDAVASRRTAAPAFRAARQIAGDGRRLGAGAAGNHVGDRRRQPPPSSSMKARSVTFNWTRMKSSMQPGLVFSLPRPVRLA